MALEIKRAISVVKEMPTGQNPLMVIGEDYEKYIIKAHRNFYPSCEIINEFLCSQLLNYWNINTPEVAGIVLNRELIPDTIAALMRRNDYSHLCFGSKFVEDSIELQEVFSLQGAVQTKKIVNYTDLFLIALFDIWVENDDRKPTNHNLLLAPNGKNYSLTAIDHAYAFSTLDYQDINPNRVSVSYNDTILHSAIGLKLLENTNFGGNWVDSYRQNYYLCIEKCKENWHSITQHIPPEVRFSIELQELVYNFLFNEARNKMVFDEFLSRLKP